MTTENSGLLPRELPPEVLASLAGAFQSEPMIHELQEMYARLLAFAAPAPAGDESECPHEAWEETGGWCKCVDCGHGWRAATPQPEQGAGLPEQWKEAAAIYREQGRNDIADVFDDCASALARQQSQAEQEAGLDTFADELAQEIRRVDGNNALGAGALADALTPFILARQQSRVVDWPSGVLNKSDTLAVIKQHNAWRRGAVAAGGVVRVCHLRPNA